jgi:hypothetical protein
VVIVPAAQIRFKREGGDYQPYQLVDGDEVELNPVTYRYLAHMTIENSPYAKPPMVAAIEPILDQHRMKKNLQFVLKKFGLFGLISAAVTPPRQEMGEATDEYQRRVQSYLKDVLKAFQENFHEGMAVYTEDIKVERTNLTTDARGVQDIFRLNEEQVFSGMGSEPAMHGRTYSTTETYARVVYDLLVRHAESFQRPVKRRIERTYQLDLALGGIALDELSLHFHQAKSRDPLTEARARQVDWRVVREQVESGLLEPDTGARKLGCDDWHDAGKIYPGIDIGADHQESSVRERNPVQIDQRHRFRFETGAQHYMHIRPKIVVVSRDTSGTRRDNGNVRTKATMIEDWLAEDH